MYSIRRLKTHHNKDIISPQSLSLGLTQFQLKFQEYFLCGYKKAYPKMFLERKEYKNS